MRIFALFLAALPALTLAQLSLSEAERLARELNPIMKSAAADVSAAKAAKPKMLASFRPMLDLRAYGGRAEGMTMDMGTGLEMLSGGGSGVNATLSWNLFSGGLGATFKSLADREIAIAESRAKNAWLDLQLEVRMEFAEGLKIQEDIEGRMASLHAALELEQVTLRLFEAGKLPEAFVFGARADRLRMERELAVAQADLQGAFARIVACCGAEIVGGRLGDWDVPFQVPDSLAAALDEAYARSPDVAMLEEEARYWALRERQTRQSGMPQVSAYAIGDRLLSGAAVEDRGTQLGLSLSFPLVDGGMRKAEAAEYRHKRIEAEAKVAVAKNNLRAKLGTAWPKWEASGKVIESAEAQIKAAEEGYRIAKLRYEEGKAIRAEVAQALADLQEARTGLAEANMYRRQAWSQVRRAMGS